MLVEDQPNQYNEITEKISSFEFPFLKQVGIGPTIESTYIDYVEKVQALPYLPTILLIDYELAWEGRSSSANGYDLVTNLLHLYPENGLPYVIFISGPHVDKIKEASDIFDFIDEKAHSVALDKSKFDLKHSKTDLTMLQFAISKGILYARKSLYVPTIITFENVYDYPNLFEIQAEKGGLTSGEFNQKVEGKKIEIELKNLLFFIFITDTAKGYMAIVTINDGNIERYLKRIERANIGYWKNNFRSAGIDFWDMNSLFCNPLHFDYNETSIITKNARTFSLIEYSFKPEFDIYNSHPFRRQINSIKPPLGLKEPYCL